MKTKLQNNCFKFAAIFLWLYAITAILRHFVGLLPIPFSVASVASAIVFAAVGGMLWMKKANIVTSILLGILTVVNLFSLFNGINVLNLLYTIACALLTAFSVMAHNGEYKNAFKFWYLPAAALTLHFIAYILVTVADPFFMIYWKISFATYVVPWLCEIALVLGFLFATLSFEQYLNEHPIEVKAKPQGEKTVAKDGYIDIILHVILLIFVGCIWQFVWIYKTTAYLNQVQNEAERSATAQLLLCMFIPFYYIYWTYQSSKRIESLAKGKNIACDIVTLSVVLSIFIGIVSPIIMQGKINEVCQSKN